MATPERMRKISVLLLRPVRSVCTPAMKTMTQEKIRTTQVRSAVATLESVFLIPHLAKTAVIPANRADAKANTIHTENPSSLVLFISLVYSLWKMGDK